MRPNTWNLGERPRDPGGGEIADGHRYRIAAGFGAQAGDHGARQVDSMDLNATAGQRQRDPARADAQLQGTAIAGQCGQEVDGRADDPRVEHPVRRVVIPGRDTLAEVPVRVIHGRNIS